METSKRLSSWSAMMSELNHGRELAKQLQNHLDPSTPVEMRQYLIQKILLTYNKLLHMVNIPCNNSFPLMYSDSSQISFRGSESSRSVSPCSNLENPGRASKKRKTLLKWVKTVKMNIEEGGEKSLNDGYKWRKYGQKTIHGATFPRGYYRCTHRNTRGCYATKQVQKSNEDPTLCQVIYKGHHTCSSLPIHVSKASTGRNQLLAEPARISPLQQTPQLKLETRESAALDVESIFSALIGTDARLASVSPAKSDSNHLTGEDAGGFNCGWTPESNVNYEQCGSGSQSPFYKHELTFGGLDTGPGFTLDDLEWVQ